MAMLVSTNPPELIVRTKRKPLPMRRDDAPFLCDRFWECVLNDYIDEFDSEDDIVATSPSRSNPKMNERLSRKKKMEKKKKHGDVLVEVLKDDDVKAISKVYSHSDKQTSSGLELSDPERQDGTEKAIALSNDLEMDHRDKGIVESPPPSKDVVDSDPTPPNEVIIKQPLPDHPRNRYRKLDARIPSGSTELLAPSKLGKGISSAKEYGPEQDTDPPTEIRKKGSAEVIHYAPHNLGQGTSSARRSAAHIPHLPTESRSTRNSRRVAIDPDEHRPPSGRLPRSRDTSDPDHSQSSSLNFLPRGPSNARGAHPLHTRSTEPRHNRTAQPKYDNLRVETIDLTNGLDPITSHLNREGRADHDRETAGGKFKSGEDNVNWMLLESRKAESDYRRRKLDRKEALDRIRAIKARLQTIDP